MSTTELAINAPTAHTARWTKRAKRAFNGLAREPLVHFVLAGALLFVASDIAERHFTRYRIAFGAEQQGRLAAAYEQQYGVAATPAELSVLKDNWVRDEILYREAEALHLDDDDEIVRRRLVQKMQFLNQDLVAMEPPTEQQLRAFYATHQALYVEPARRSLVQLYFSPDHGGDANALARATAARHQLQSGKTVSGDIFSGPQTLANIDDAGLTRIFGGDDFAHAVFVLPPGAWSAPLHSGLGWHLVRVQHETPPRTPAFEAIQQRVREDFDAERRRVANDTAFAAVRHHYTIVNTP